MFYRKSHFQAIFEFLRNVQVIFTFPEYLVSNKFYSHSHVLCSIIFRVRIVAHTIRECSLAIRWTICTSRRISNSCQSNHQHQCFQLQSINWKQFKRVSTSYEARVFTFFFYFFMKSPENEIDRYEKKNKIKILFFLSHDFIQIEPEHFEHGH